MKNFEIELKKLRDEIDFVDSKIYESIYQRVLLTGRIGELKKECGVSEMNEQRRNEIYEKMKSLAVKDGVPVYLISKIYDVIFESSITEQTILINKKNK
jgi:chorismate mutase